VGDLVEQRRQERVGIQVLVDRDPVTRPARARRPVVAELGPPGPGDDHVAGDDPRDDADEIAARSGQKGPQMVEWRRGWHGEGGL
jgi:hypothetical protein